MPERLQRKRTKGYKLPEGTIYVGRPGRWGNPFKVGSKVGTVPHWVVSKAGYWACSPLDLITRGMAVDFYRVWLRHRATESKYFRESLKQLRGKNLACWCKPGEPCHGDVLLKAVNGEPF
jgi:hypothetical protein